VVLLVLLMIFINITIIIITISIVIFIIIIIITIIITTVSLVIVFRLMSEAADHIYRRAKERVYKLIPITTTTTTTSATTTTTSASASTKTIKKTGIKSSKRLQEHSTNIDANTTSAMDGTIQSAAGTHQ